MKTLVFIPTYRCAGHLAPLLRDTRKALADKVSEIALVDNQRDDATIETAVSLRKSLSFENLSIISNKDNYGLGGSHKVAIRYALENGFSHLLVLHGDNQADATEGPALLKIAEENPSLDAVLGIRFADRKKLHGYSLFRTLGNHGLNGLFSVVLGKKVTDLGSGLNLFSVAKLATLDLESYSDFCDFNIYLLIDMLKQDWKIANVPITWRQEDQVSTNRAIEMGKRALKILFTKGLAGTPSPTPTLLARPYETK